MAIGLGEGPLSEPEPITRQQIVSVGAIEDDVRGFLDGFEGEDRVKRLVDYISLTVLEVALSKDFSPGLIRNKNDEKAKLVSRLVQGVIQRP